MNILLIAGGWSSERDVSLNGAKVIQEALVKKGHAVTLFDPQNSLDGLIEATHKKDFAFINLHGSPGEDGIVQAMLERVGLPYQGSGPAPSFLALNKAATKAIYKAGKLPTAEWVLLTKKPEQSWQPPFAFPIFIKSNTGGSSLGMERVENAAALPAALDRLFALGGEFIVEPVCSGVEVTCGVLGEDPAKTGQNKESVVALPPILIRPKKSDVFFDYSSKYQKGGAEEICPAPLEEVTYRQVQDYAKRAHELLGLSGYSRTDFILHANGSLILLETNTLPGMTSTSLVPQEAAAIGIDFISLLERLIALGIAAQKQRGSTASL